jgi:predicted CoA-binding protein
MSNPSCPLPIPPSRDESAIIERILDFKRVAVIGASDNEMRAGHYVPAYLLSHGYDIIPINPNHAEVLGRKCYPTLADVPGDVDVVNVFRRPNACADVTRQAIAKGVKAIWLQSGITNAEAQKLAQEACVDFIQDRCIMVEHRRRRS